jgi:gliding motility-associated lipoprotein GldD
MKSLINKILLVLLFLPGCKNDYTPKPAGFMRIDFPEKKYILFDSTCPYRFEYPVYSIIEPDKDKNTEPYWINIVFPTLNGKIHISYKKINHDLSSMTEESRDLAYKHTVKAEAINETLIVNKEKKVFGILYDIQGSVASSVQFILTDSTRHFLRGSLYFYSHPNKDSLMPVIKFCRSDIEHMIQTFEWEKDK